jgi:cold shock CspA family protein
MIGKFGVNFGWLSNPLVAGVVGASIGFLLCWSTMVRPLVVHLDQREKSLHEWERINRQEREAIADIKTIGTEELRKWVSTLDEQNTRYAQLQSLLHKQELSLVGPSTSHLWISLVAVLGVVGFVMWMMRDSNADAARTLRSAVAVLPSLREALRENRAALEEPATDAVRLEAVNPSHTRALSTNRKTGKVTKFIPDRAFGFIVPDDGGAEVFFHRSTVKSLDSRRIADGIAVSFRLGKDRSGRPCAEDVEISG